MKSHPNHENIYAIFGQYFLELLHTDEVKDKMLEYCRSNRDVVEHFSESLLKKKHIEVDDWLDYMSEDDSIPDKIVVSGLSWMVMVHMCVVTKKSNWLTCKGKNSDQCTIFVAYMGHGKFVLTEEIPDKVERSRHAETS